MQRRTTLEVSIKPKRCNINELKFITKLPIDYSALREKKPDKTA